MTRRRTSASTGMPFDHEFGVEPPGLLKVFTPDETAQLAERWLQNFGAAGGVNTRAYLWHVFSDGRTPADEGEAARAAYAAHTAPSFIVLDNRRTEAIEMAQRPLRCNLSDWYVFPPNFAWTMAFTHEEGWLGPYFARHESYAQRHADNLARIDKQEGIAAARAQGWL